MTVNYSHSHASGFTSEGSVTEDKLYDNFSVRRKGTIASGQGVLLRGTALGKIKTGAATSAAKSGGNTGNGALASLVVAQPDKAGIYTVRFTAATTFVVEDPDGYVIGNGATGATFTDDVAFTITAGGTPFVAGDGFDITIAPGSGKWVKSVAAATDGSQVVRGILLHDVDATGADIEAIIGRIGTCNGGAVLLGAGHTLASIDDACIDRGIILDKIFG